MKVEVEKKFKAILELDQEEVQHILNMLGPFSAASFKDRGVPQASADYSYSFFSALSNATGLRCQSLD